MVSKLFVVTDAKCCNSKYSGILDKYTCVKQGFPAVLHVKAATVMANLALVAPARNCDVGTADEQEKRWGCNCGHGIPRCSKCAVYAEAKKLGLVKNIYLMACDCKFIWAQMPNNEGTANRGDLCHED